MSGKIRKITALFLGLCMILGMVPEMAITAFAESNTEGTVNYTAGWNDDGSAVELTVTPQNTGTVYYMMEDSGAAVPNESDVVKQSSSACAAGTATTIDISSDTQGAKDIYLVYQDEGANVSDAMTVLKIAAFSTDGSAVTTDTYAYKIDSDDLDFGTVEEGYTDQEAKTLTISNTGTKALQLSIKSGADNYDVDLSTSDLAAGDSATLAVQPKTDLTEGNYDTTIKLAATSDGAEVLSPEISVKFTINAAETAETSTSEEQSESVNATTANSTSEESESTSGDSSLSINATTAEVQSESSVSVDYGVKWLSTSSIQLSVTSTKAGTAYYIVQESGTTPPTSDNVKASGNTITATADTESTATVSASSNTEKDVYFVFVDSDNETYDMTTMTLPAYKTVSGSESSTVGSVSFSGERNGSDYLSLTVEPTVAGRLYYIVQDTDTTAPTEAELLAADSISESAGTAKTTQISLGDNPTNAKKLYLLYVASSDGSIVGGTAIMDVPALNSSSFTAEIDPSELDLGTVLEGYSASDAAATSTISNTGDGTVSFTVDTTADGYTDFSQYFDVDTSGAVNIASGEDGSVTVTPIEGLSAGTYSGTFYLVDQIDDTNTLTLGPVTVTMTVAEKGTSTVEGVRSPEGEYTPTIEWIKSV